MNRRQHEPAIESPCTKVCTVDPTSRLCVGCLRTIEEIAGWGRMSPQERRAVMADLPSRTSRLEVGAPAPAPGSGAVSSE